MSAPPAEAPLSVQDLCIGFRSVSGAVTVVDRLSFSVGAKETLAIVGESGCGKTVTGLSLMGLLPPRTARVSGSILLGGRQLVGIDERELRRLRGRHIAMIFQDPMSALNPVHTIGDQLIEVIQAHEPISRAAAWKRAEEVLALVRMPEPQRRMREYPHRLSGGMRQRVVIGMALATNPSVLIADEPTTALDVTIQAQILRLLADLQSELGMSIILITHDLGVVAEVAHRVMVMYAGRKVEEQSVFTIFDRPRHPYTRGLIAARPQPGALTAETGRLSEIKGMVPSLNALPQGCAFGPRCGLVDDRCRSAVPGLEHSGNARVACFHPHEYQVAGAV